MNTLNNLTFLPITVFDVIFYNGTKYITLDSLKITNLTQEGPEKETRGGVRRSVLARHGKTARLEIESAILDIDALETFFGAKIQNNGATISITNTFPNPLQIFGRTFFLNKKGEKVDVKLEFFNFLPDGLLNLTMEAEGDFGVFDMSGELFANDCGKFYNIIIDQSEYIWNDIKCNGLQSWKVYNYLGSHEDGYWASITTNLEERIQLVELSSPAQFPKKWLWLIAKGNDTSYRFTTNINIKGSYNGITLETLQTENVLFNNYIIRFRDSASGIYVNYELKNKPLTSSISFEDEDWVLYYQNNTVPNKEQLLQQLGFASISEAVRAFDRFEIIFNAEEPNSSFLISEIKLVE